MSDTTKTADLARTIASIALRFGRVTRATLDHEGEPETDTTHTVMLQLLVIETLPKGRSLEVALALAAVHDLPEFLDGDICTARELPPAVRAMKEASERAAIEQLRELGLLNCVALIEAYERRDCWEAGFINIIDKCAPKLTHLINGGQALRALDMSVEEMAEKHRRQGAELRAKYPEQVEALALFDALCEACERELATELADGGLPGSLDIDDGYPSEDAVAAISRYRGDIAAARAWQTPQTQALLRADLDAQAQLGAQNREPRIVSLSGYPSHEPMHSKRVVWLADGAKQALFGGGCPPLADDLLLRAAIALDSMPREIDACQATLTLARIFAPGLELQAERDALLTSLASQLCDPMAELARACATNQRLLRS